MQHASLVGGFNQPLWKICSSNWIISPNRDENKKYLKPPSSSFYDGSHVSIKNWGRDRIPTDPGPSKLRDRAMIDTEVFSGSVKRGSDRWRFLGMYTSIYIICIYDCSTKSLIFSLSLIFCGCFCFIHLILPGVFHTQKIIQENTFHSQPITYQGFWVMGRVSMEVIQAKKWML